MRSFFITGTDTEAGKTLISAALSLLLGRHEPLLLIKPVQTGCLPAADGLDAPDVTFVRAKGGRAVALHCYEPPCSPHLAAELAGERLDCAELARKVRSTAEDRPFLVEGAGGCHVPINDDETMLDLMQALRLPVIVVVANRLGCLNHALLSLEALRSRGLDAAGLILTRTRPSAETDAGCGPAALPEDETRILHDNAISLRHWAARYNVPLLADIPYLGPDPDLAHLLELLRPAAAALAAFGEGRAARMQADLQFDREHLWHPYTSAVSPLPVREVAATRGNRLVLADGTELVDGMSSWWCCSQGYGNARIKRAMHRQLETMSHVMFGGLTHRPAVALGERLLPLLPGRCQWLFYADSGSVAVEVALKMAVQYQLSMGRTNRRHYMTPLGGYHGDTQGAMSVCDPVTGMHTLFSGLLPQHYFVERPSCRFDAPFDADSLNDARRVMAAHADSIAAVILEPIVQGAGGMWFYHPEYLKGLRELCDAYDILLVADEIATGFGRTGRLFACEWAGVSPDICCVGKALTGGMMTGAVTAATDRVARGIGAARPEHGGGVLMHGPTFMANPLFCAAALASVDELLASPWQTQVAQIEEGLRAGLAPCASLPGVADVRVLGAIGVVEMREPVNMARLQDFFVSQGVWIRPFNRLVYVMPPFVTPPQDVARLCAAVCGAAALT